MVQRATNNIHFEYVLRPGETLPAQMRGHLVQSLSNSFDPGLAIDFIEFEQLSQAPSYKRKKVIRAFA
ncbi:hypothetical protein D9M68_985640 [compost metagenome]